MSNYAISLKRTASLAAAIALMAALTLVSFSSFLASRASAEQLSSRSLSLSSSLAGNQTTGAAGSETNGSDVVYTFGYTTGSSGSSAVAMRLLFCTTAIGTCTTPTGLDTTGATVTGQTGTSGLVEDTFLVNGTLDLDTGTFANSTASTLTISNITNPTTIGSFFVRISTSSTVPGGTLVDDGTVASSITTGIAITSRVAETLGFSTTGDSGIDGATGIVAPTGACVPVTGSGALTLGDETEQTLSITQAYDNYSAFRIYTNASQGVVVTYEGDTLRKSGTEEITAIGAGAVASDVAAEQFGLAADLVQGGTSGIAVASSSGTADLTNVNVATDLDSGTGGEIDVAAAYEDGEGTITDGGAASFAFVANTSTTIASSSTYVDCKTVAIRYIANIAPLTEAGTYTTTIVYSAVPTY